MEYIGNDFYCDMALSGKAKLDVVAETEDILVFHHTKPFWPVHIVIIPKMHIPSLIDFGDFDQKILNDLMKMVQQIAAKVNEEHGAARVLTNLGEYQDSKHLHFHVSFGMPFNIENTL